MRLSELLSPSRIRVPLKAGDKEGILRELVGLMLAGNGGATGAAGGAGGAGGARAGGGGGVSAAQADEILGAILERERQFPTGIGYGVAVPHGRCPALSGLIVVAGTTPAPIPYETIDGEPVRLFFLLAGPESHAGVHVKALSRISRLVRREPVRGRLLAARTAEEFHRALVEAEVA